jgi:hypothetical protein
MSYLPHFRGIDFKRWLPEVQAAYPAERLNHLAEEHDVSAGCDFEEMVRTLFFSGAAYLQHRSDFEDSQNWTHRRETYRKLLGLLKEVQAALQKLDNSGEEEFWLPELSLHKYFATRAGDISPFGHTLRRIKTGKDTHAMVYLRKSDHLEAIEIMRRYALEAMRRSPLTPASRSSDFILWIWVENIRHFWTNCLGRDFTYSASKRLGGKSAAFLFCRDAIKLLDTSITSSNVSTAVRAVIADRLVEATTRAAQRQAELHVKHKADFAGES